MKKTAARLANETLMVTIFFNVFLTVIKLIAGVIGNSTSMISDAIHSLSDVLSSIGVFIGLTLAKRPADESHPYGHEKFEPILTKILSFILFMTGMSIGLSALETIMFNLSVTPKSFTLWAALISILTKEWMYHFTMSRAKQIDSSALAADAWHHRTDALSSIAALIGIMGARMGYPLLDPIAALFITLIILKAAIDIFIQATNQVTDHAASPDTIKQIETIILSTPGVIAIDKLKTRIHSNRIYVDLEIAVNASLSLIDAHAIAETVHRRLERELPLIKHCMVHVNPAVSTSSPLCYHPDQDGD